MQKEKCCELLNSQLTLSSIKFKIAQSKVSEHQPFVHHKRQLWETLKGSRNSQHLDHHVQRQTGWRTKQFSLQQANKMVRSAIFSTVSSKNFWLKITIPSYSPKKQVHIFVLKTNHFGALMVKLPRALLLQKRNSEYRLGNGNNGNS